MKFVAAEHMKTFQGRFLLTDNAHSEYKQIPKQGLGILCGIKWERKGMGSAQA